MLVGLGKERTTNYWAAKVVRFLWFLHYLFTVS